MSRREEWARQEALDRLFRKNSTRNAAYFTYAEKAGCALCLEIFDIKTTKFRMIPNYDSTYVCPTCDVDSLITDNNGVKGVDLIELTPELLLELKALLTKKGWFGLKKDTANEDC